VSAPFLAIATYYLLLWLDLTPKPVIVLVSFSVGLISDQIIERLIDVVRGLLNPDAKKAAAKAAAAGSRTVAPVSPVIGIELPTDPGPANLS